MHNKSNDIENTPAGNPKIGKYMNIHMQARFQMKLYEMLMMYNLYNLLDPVKDKSLEYSITQQMLHPDCLRHNNIFPRHVQSQFTATVNQFSQSIGSLAWKLLTDHSHFTRPNLAVRPVQFWPYQFSLVLMKKPGKNRYI